MSNMVDYDKLVDLSTKGLACLCFRNKDKLSTAEITVLFSRYGEVVGINCGGNFCFVRFRTKEEALRCAKAMDDNPSVRLQPVRSKTNQNQSNDQLAKNKQTNFNSQQNFQSHRHGEETEKANSTNGSQSSRNARKKLSHRQNNDNGSQNYDNGANNFNNGNSRKSQEYFDQPQSARNYQNPTGKHFDTSPAKDFAKINKSSDKMGNAPTNTDKFMELNKRRGTIANTFQPSGIQNPLQLPRNGPTSDYSAPIISSPPSLIHSSRRQSPMTERPPPLVADVPLPQSDEGRRIIPAFDVIVANIPPKMDENIICKIFQKFSPVYVSDIETIPEINVRFCYVYFDNPSDASKVEESFDGVAVWGQNLITLRPRIIEANTRIL